MDDHTQPSDESMATPATVSGNTTKVLQFEQNVAGLLCYVPVFPVNAIFSIMWLCTEPNSNTVLRFHAMQSLMICGAGVAFGIASTFLAIIPLVGLLMMPISLLVWAAMVAVNIVCMIKAYRGEMYKLPYIGEFAEKQLSNLG